LPSTPSSVPSDPAPAPSRRARWILAGFAVALVVVVGAITWVAVADNDDTPKGAAVPAGALRAGGPKVGDQAPDFTLQTLDGKTVSLSDYRGQPVVINFWASWCNPCREEFPMFRQQLADHRGKFVLLGIDYHNDIASDAKKFAKSQRATWPTLADSDNAVALAYGVRPVPQTFFIKRDGTIAARYYAPVPSSDFPRELAKITKPAAN
jgi:peroxiredoxin